MIPVAEKMGDIVRSSDSFERKQFTIAATSESFAILSNGLYSDKITAVLRELGTNATDAHVMAGATKPFHVHLPTNSECWFSLRDYGTGLSYDEVMDPDDGIYTTYFASNKRGSNELVGSLGLGSKSPLSVSRSFTVTSFYNGMKYHYIITLNESNFPEANYLADQTVSTNEPNGLLVQFSCKSGDIYEFQQKAVQVYQYFAIRPTFNISLNFPTIKTVIKGEDNKWAVVNGRAGMSGARVVMGNIAYPIVAAKLTGLTPNEQSVIGQNVEIEVEIGEVQFTPSRESLSYSPFTIKNIRVRLQQVVKEVLARVTDELDKCKNLWAARIFSRSMLYGQNAELKSLRALLPDLAYKNNNLNIEQIIINKCPDYQNFEVSLFAKLSKTSNRGYYDYEKEVNKVNKLTTNFVIAREHTVFVELDIDPKKRPHVGIRQAIERGDYKYVYAFTFNTDKARDKLCKYIGIDKSELIKASTLHIDKKPYIKTATNLKRLGTVLVYNTNPRGRTLRDFWTEDKSIDLDTGGIYVDTKNYQPVVDDRTTHPINLGDVVRAIGAISGKPISVIGIKSEKAIKRVAADKRWFKLTDFVQDLVKKSFDKDDVGWYYRSAARYRNDNIDGIDALAKTANGMSAGYFNNVMDTVNKINKFTLFSHWNSLVDFIKFDVTSYSEADIHKMIEKLYIKYPLVKLLVDNVWHSSLCDKTIVSSIIEYVNLKENM